MADVRRIGGILVIGAGASAAIAGPYTVESDTVAVTGSDADFPLRMGSSQPWVQFAPSYSSGLAGSLLDPFGHFAVLGSTNTANLPDGTPVTPSSSPTGNWNWLSGDEFRGDGLLPPYSLNTLRADGNTLLAEDAIIKGEFSPGGMLYVMTDSGDSTGGTWLERFDLNEIALPGEGSILYYADTVFPDPLNPMSQIQYQIENFLDFDVSADSGIVVSASFLELGSNGGDYHAGVYVYNGDPLDTVEITDTNLTSWSRVATTLGNSPSELGASGASYPWALDVFYNVVVNNNHDVGFVGETSAGVVVVGAPEPYLHVRRIIVKGGLNDDSGGSLVEPDFFIEDHEDRSRFDLNELGTFVYKGKFVPASGGGSEAPGIWMWRESDQTLQRILGPGDTLNDSTTTETLLNNSYTVLDGPMDFRLLDDDFLAVSLQMSGLGGNSSAAIVGLDLTLSDPRSSAHVFAVNDAESDASQTPFLDAVNRIEPNHWAINSRHEVAVLITDRPTTYSEDPIDGDIYCQNGLGKWIQTPLFSSGDNSGSPHTVNVAHDPNDPQNEDWRNVHRLVSEWSEYSDFAPLLQFVAADPASEYRTSYLSFSASVTREVDEVVIDDSAAFVVRLGCDNSATCPPDFNNDGKVDGLDNNELLAFWGSSDVCHDLTGDGVVNGMDLNVVLASWGTCP